MEKLFLFIAILTQLSFGQSASTMLLLMSGSDYKNVETTQYLAGQTVTPTQAARIDQFITMLKDSLQITSLSSKFDVMYLLANESAALGLRNLVKRSHDATAVNSPTFTQWEGFLGANTKLINTNYNPNTQGLSYTKNSATGLLYRRSAGNISRSIIGATQTGTGASILYQHNPITTIYYNINTSNDISGTSIETTLGVMAHTRTSSSNTNLYTNSTSVASSTANNSTNVPDGDLYILAENLIGTGARRFYDGQISVVLFGAGLSGTDMGRVVNCIEWYMDDLGKGVIP